MRPEQPSQALSVPMQKGNREPETLSLTAAAQLLGIGPKAARRAVLRGDLRAVKINGRWRVLREPLEALLGISRGGEAV